VKLILGIILLAVLAVGMATIPSIDATSGKLTIRGESSTIYSNESVYYKGKLTDSEGYAISFERINIWEQVNGQWQYVAQGTTNARGEYTITIPANHWNYAKTVNIVANSASAIQSPSLLLNIAKSYKSSSQSFSNTDSYVKDTNLILEIKTTKLDEKNRIIELKPIVMSDDGYKPYSKSIKFYGNGKYIGIGTTNEWYNAGVYSYGSHKFIAKYTGTTIHFIDYGSSSGTANYSMVDKTLNTKHTTSSNSNLLKNTQSTHSSTQYKDSTYSLKSKYYDLLQELESGIKLSKSTLSGLSFENNDAQKKIESAWNMQYMTSEYVDEGKEILKQTEVYLKNHNYQKAWTELHQFDKQANSVKSNMYMIVMEIKNGKDSEESFQEKNKSCFLFWCSGSDATKGLDHKITNLELKTEKIKNKQKDIVNDYQNVMYDQKLIKQKDDSKKEQEILKKEQKAELKQQQILAKQEQKILEEQKEKELKTQKLLAKQEQERLEREKEIELRNQQIRSEKEQERLERERMIEESRTNPVLRGIIDGTMYFYIEPIPSYYDVAGINSGVNDIANSLERNFHGVDIRRTYDQNSADIVILWVKDFGSSTLGHAIFKSVVEIELGSDTCWGGWQPYTVTSIKKVMWHEIGHSLGYSHSNDPNNIMYYTTSPQFHQDISHRFDLESGYSQWFSFCSSGNVSFHAESSKNSDGFNVFAIPSTDPVEFSHNGGSTYLDSSGNTCGAKNIQSITRYCDVGNGAYLHFKNTESHTIYITFEMYNQNDSFWPNMTWDQSKFEYDLTYLNYVRNMFH
jgi:hypothetical protein